MKLDVSHVPEWGLDVDVEVNAREIDLSDAGAELEGDLQLRGKVLKAGDEMVLSGKLRAVFNLVCSRCLKDFVQPLEFDVSATYIQTPETRTGVRVEADLDEDARIAFVDDEIDLVSGVREDLVLNIPVKPLCKQDCRGLCAQCGTDLNEGQCSCRQETVDPRLAALRDIRTEMKQQSSKLNKV
jgi:uncharacterized protein